MTFLRSNIELFLLLRQKNKITQLAFPSFLRMNGKLTIPEKMSGYELARRVLEHPSGGIDALLDLSGNNESDWLELKAGMCLLPEDENKGYKPDDLYWNIAAAVLEIMNTFGGVLIIGIEDKTHKVVPLCENDPRHVIEQRGFEAYRRQEIFERIWHPDKAWKSPKRNNIWRIMDVVPENLLELRGVQYQGEEIAVILIRPAVPAIRIWKNEEVEQIRARNRGEVGKHCKVIGSKRMELYEENRCIETETYASLYRQFLSNVEAEMPSLPRSNQVDKYTFNNRSYSKEEILKIARMQLHLFFVALVLFLLYSSVFWTIPWWVAWLISIPLCLIFFLMLKLAENEKIIVTVLCAFLMFVPWINLPCLLFEICSSRKILGASNMKSSFWGVPKKEISDFEDHG